MNNSKELKWNELKISYRPSELSFVTTRELTRSSEIIGQEDALNALELGLKMNAEGYNLYVCADCGVSQLSTVIKKLIKQTGNIKRPQDICYSYHFANPEVPKLILLHPGEGIKFKEDMDEFIQFIINELPLKMKSYEINKKKQLILDELEEEKEELISQLSEDAEDMGILVKITKEGIGFAPLGSKGDIITKEEYNHLSREERASLDEQLSRLSLLADEMVKSINEKEEQCLEWLDDIDKSVFINEVGALIKYLKEKYFKYSQIQSYLDAVCEDILQNLNVFVSHTEENNKGIKEVIPWMTGNEVEKLAKRYYINVLVDHSHTIGVPIVTSAELGSHNLNGKILLDTEFNMPHSDFANIRSGLFHKVNGGYLILDMETLFEHFNNWQVLKKMLKTGYIHIENSEDMTIATVSALRPEPLKANIKVILIGNYMQYKALYEHDGDFKRLFKKRIDFDKEIKNSEEHFNQLGSLIRDVCEKEKLPAVTAGALKKICEYGNRIVQTPKKLPANLDILLDLIREASCHSEQLIDENCVQKAIIQRQLFKRRLEDKMDERIIENTYLIDTIGEKIGQVNGLAIYTVDDYRIGRPVKITATTYRGKEGIVDIEKESGLSGEIHTKGIQIITGFLGHNFAQDMPLSVSCNICFEQSYSGIDGDSASSVELYAILSSLSDLPIKQNLSATGSVNQYGQIQPIGGVNEKIEGFFKICQKRGLKGDEGVIIPIQNKEELMLEDEVIEAVKMNQFHIYTITTIKEGIEIMTGLPYGEIEKRIKQKLYQFNIRGKN